MRSAYGLSEGVLKSEKRPLESERIAAGQVAVKVTTRLIHRGDIHILSALPPGGPAQPIAPGTVCIPGFEGGGTTVRVGGAVLASNKFREGQRVAFFSENGSGGNPA